MDQYPPPLTEALDRVVDAAQEVASDHLRLARLEAKLTLVRGVEAVGMLAIAATPCLIGWSALMLALHLTLGYRLAPTWSLACIGVLNLLLATWITRQAMRHVARENPPRGVTS